MWFLIYVWMLGVGGVSKNAVEKAFFSRLINFNSGTEKRYSRFRTPCAHWSNGLHVLSSWTHTHQGFGFFSNANTVQNLEGTAATAFMSGP